MTYLKFKTRTLWVVGIIFLTGCREEPFRPVLDQAKLANEYYQEDAQWYLDNIPFFECSDNEIEQVYYYRWKMYKAHIRSIGSNRYVITEFINHVSWEPIFIYSPTVKYFFHQMIFLLNIKRMANGSL